LILWSAASRFSFELCTFFVRRLLRIELQVELIVS
jgi:hypothetical protein